MKYEPGAVVDLRLPFSQRVIKVLIKYERVIDGHHYIECQELRKPNGSKQLQDFVNCGARTLLHNGTTYIRWNTRSIRLKEE